MQKNQLQKIFERYIRNTAHETIVHNEKVKICRLSQEIVDLLQCSTWKVYITTRCLKHIYDKRPAQEFDFIMENLHSFLKNPDAIYQNKDRKRGNFCFLKQMNGSPYLVPVEIVVLEDGTKEPETATAFRMRDDKYLRNYELLWSRSDDAHSS